MKSNSGFTLVEVLVAMVVTLVVLGGAYVAFNSQQKNTAIQTRVSDAQQTLRAAMDYLARDIRMAGYDPDLTNNFGITDVKFRDINGALNAAGNSYIAFAWDKDSDGALDNDERMNYSLVDEATITPGVSDLFLRFPLVSADRDVLASNIVSFGLAYAIDSDGDSQIDQSGGATMWVVDADNDDDWDRLTINQAAGTVVSAETGIPVNTKDIRAVRIWMVAQSEAPDPQFTDNKTYVVGPRIFQPNNNFRHRMLERTVLCRNMGLNL